MLWWLLQTTMVTTGLAGVLVLLGSTLGRRPAVMHALWLSVLLKLVLPPVLFWPWSLGGLLPPAFFEQSRASLNSESEIAPASIDEIVLIAGADAGEIELAASAEDQRPSETLHPASEPRFSLSTLTAICTWIWLAGAAFMLIRQARCIYRGTQLCRSGQPAPAWLIAEVGEVANQLRTRMPRVVVSNGVTTPCVWSVGPTRLIWPAVLIQPRAFSWRGVIAHELAHLKRRDHWVAWLELLASCVWWWNPLFWFVQRRLHECREQACDGWAISLEPERRRTYAAALLEICRISSHGRMSVPALGASTGELRLMKRRLTMIFSERTRCRLSWSGLSAAVLVALLAIPCWSLAQDPSDEKAPATPPTKQAKPAAPTKKVEASATTKQKPSADSIKKSAVVEKKAAPVDKTKEKPSADSAKKSAVVEKKVAPVDKTKEKPGADSAKKSAVVDKKAAPVDKTKEKPGADSAKKSAVVDKKAAAIDKTAKKPSADSAKKSAVVDKKIAAIDKTAKKFGADSAKKSAVVEKKAAPVDKTKQKPSADSAKNSDAVEKKAAPVDKTKHKPKAQGVDKSGVDKKELPSSPKKPTAPPQPK